MKNLLAWLLLCCCALAAPSYSPARSDLEGVWDQFYGGYFTCRLRLQATGKGYGAQTLKVAAGVTPTVIRTYEHRLQGNVWVFKSDWQELGIAEFRLNRKSPDRFEGYAYLKGTRRPDRTTWIRQR